MRNRRERWNRRDVTVGVAEEIGVCGIEFLLEPLDLSLEERDGTDAAIDGVSHARLCLVGE